MLLLGMKQIAEKLPDLGLGATENRNTTGCDCINPTHRFTHALLGRLEITLFFQAVKHRIKRTGADIIAMLAQVIHHPHATNILLLSLVENMKPHQARVQALVLFERGFFTFRYSHSNLITAPLAKPRAPNHQVPL